MNYVANSISRSLPDWATALGVSEYAIIAELRQGKSMQDIVHSFSTDTFSAQTPPCATASQCLFVTKYGPSPQKPTYSLSGDCIVCMSKAKDYYDSLHNSHAIALAASAENVRRDEKHFEEFLASVINSKDGGTPAPESERDALRHVSLGGQDLMTRHIEGQHMNGAAGGT